MENTGVNLKLPRYKTVLLNCGGLMYSAWFCFALLYARVAVDLLGLTAALIVLPCTVIVSAAAVPVAYFLINRTKSRLWGRYHFSLAAIVVIMALTCGALWNVNPLWPYGAKVFTVCICMLLLGLGAVTVTYIVYSVNARLMDAQQSGGKYKRVFQAVGFLAGFALTVLTLTTLSVGDAGFVLACVIIVSGCALYFASVSYIPRFMRPLTRKVTFVSAFRAFFRRIEAVNWLSFSGYFLANASSVVFFGSLLPLSLAYGLASSARIAVLASAVAAGLMSYLWGVRSRFREPAAIAGCLMCALSLTAFTVLTRINVLSALPLGLLLCAAAAVCGFGLGLCLSSATVRADKISKSNAYTPGIFVCLKGMTLLCAMGAGIALSAALWRASPFIDIVAAALTCSLAIAAAVTLTVAARLYLGKLNRRLRADLSDGVPSVKGGVQAKMGESGGDSGDIDNKSEVSE